jgi:hypothetical protein
MPVYHQLIDDSGFAVRWPGIPVFVTQGVRDPIPKWQVFLMVGAHSMTGRPEIDAEIPNCAAQQL